MDLFRLLLQFPGVLEDYDAGRCRVMAIGYEDTSMDKVFLEKLCERDLVYNTNSPIAEIPIAFPIRSDLAAGFSYWMYQGERYHKASIQTSKDEYTQEIACNVHFSEGDTETSDYDEITVRNFFLPIVFFLACAVLAVILQIVHLYNVKKGKRSLVGRRSSLNLVTDSPKQDSIVVRMKRRSSRGEIGTGSKEAEEEEEDCDDSESHPKVHSTKSIMSGSLQLDDENQRQRVRFEGW